MSAVSRTDLIKQTIVSELESQRAALDAGTPLTGVSVFVHLHPSGDIRSIKCRLDQQREMDQRNGKRRLLSHNHGQDR
jgi:hypothetical protein